MAEISSFLKSIPAFKKGINLNGLYSSAFGKSIYYNGFAHILKEKYRLESPLVTDAKWVHGVIYQPIHCLRFLDGLRSDSLIIVPNTDHVNHLHSLGFYNVISGGVPFIYVNTAVKDKIPSLAHSVLAIPSHSFENKGQVSEYLDYLYEIRNNHEYIFVSLASHRYKDTFFDECQSACVERKLIPLRGAIAEDVNSLVRVKHILSSFSYITTNSLGSHIAHSLEVGAKVSITGPFFQISKIPEKEIFFGEKEVRLFERLLGKERALSELERLFDSYGEPSVRSYLGKFFVKDVYSGVSDVKLGRELCGSDYMLSADVIGSIFISGHLRIAKEVARKVRKRLHV